MRENNNLQYRLINLSQAVLSLWYRAKEPGDRTCQSIFKKVYPLLYCLSISKSEKVLKNKFINLIKSCSGLKHLATINPQISFYIIHTTKLNIVNP